VLNGIIEKVKFSPYLQRTVDLGRGRRIKVFKRREVIQVWSKGQEFSKGAGKAITHIKHDIVLVV